MKVAEHEHPLNLIDLEKKYADEEEESDDDENDDLAIQELFRCPCDRCGQVITRYHRYYYKCSHSCDYSIHESCAKLPPTLKHTSHNAHILTLVRRMGGWRCDICLMDHEPQDIRYRCSRCDFDVDISCVKVTTKCIIHHPSHTHPLVQITRPISCECDACGKTQRGSFYQCTTCMDFFVHSSCVFLPKKSILEQTTNGSFSHTHPLTLSYSFPIVDQQEKHNPRCRVCDRYFDKTPNLWIYKCDKCWFYIHLDCAKSTTTYNFLSHNRIGNMPRDIGDALHFPFPDETYSMVKHKFFKENGYPTFGNLTHMSHQHPLILVDNITKPTSSSSRTRMEQVSSCHNPMKKIELLCNGCVRPIANKPFYKCANESCNFALHEWCTRLPDQVKNLSVHKHTLDLLPTLSHMPFGVFKCAVCELKCNGFVYTCIECDYHTDVNCAFTPQKIRHEAYPRDIFRISDPYHYKDKCRSCFEVIRRDEYVFRCVTSLPFALHIVCALFLPKAIRHKYDKHPLKLSYYPIENHKSLYFCEICEEELDPSCWFYHCYECDQSIHCACAPLIVESERACRHPSSDTGRIYQYLNIKFGGIHYDIEGHPHPLSFVQGTVADGPCVKCLRSLRYKLILKCLQCKFGIHFECVLLPMAVASSVYGHYDRS